MCGDASCRGSPGPGKGLQRGARGPGVGQGAVVEDRPGWSRVGLLGRRGERSLGQTHLILKSSLEMQKAAGSPFGDRDAAAPTVRRLSL